MSTLTGEGVMEARTEVKPVLHFSWFCGFWITAENFNYPIHNYFLSVL